MTLEMSALLRFCCARVIVELLWKVMDISTCPPPGDANIHYMKSIGCCKLIDIPNKQCGKYRYKKNRNKDIGSLLLKKNSEEVFR